MSVTEPDTVLRRVAQAGIEALERRGPGPAVVFLHGIGSSADSFRPLAAHLPGPLRLVAWNAPGYGGSAPLAAARPVPGDYAAALERLMDALGIARAHLVGHSLGTLIAAAFASREPERVASLTLAAAAQGYATPPGAPLPPKAAARLNDLARLGPAAFAAARAPGLVADPAAHPDTVAQVEAEMARIDPAGYAQAVHMLAAGDLPAAMGAVPMRPGFILGAGDTVTPLAQTQAAADAWAAAHGSAPPVRLIPGAGHAVHVQAPEAFAEALIGLVASLEAPDPQPAEGDRNGR